MAKPKIKDGGFLMVNVSGIQSGEYHASSNNLIQLSGTTSGTVGVTIPMAVPSPRILELDGFVVTEVQVQNVNCGGFKSIAFNYGFKVPQGQGWKYQLTDKGA